MQSNRSASNQLDTASIIVNYLTNNDPALISYVKDGVTRSGYYYGDQDQQIKDALSLNNVTKQINELTDVIIDYPDSIDALYQRAIRHTMKHHFSAALVDIYTIFLINTRFNLPLFITDELFNYITSLELFESIVAMTNNEQRISLLKQCLNDDTLFGQHFAKPDESIRAIKLAIIKLLIMLTHDDLTHDDIPKNQLLENTLLKCADKHAYNSNYSYTLRCYELVQRQNPNHYKANMYIKTPKLIEEQALSSLLLDMSLIAIGELTKIKAAEDKLATFNEWQKFFLPLSAGIDYMIKSKASLPSAANESLRISRHIALFNPLDEAKRQRTVLALTTTPVLFSIENIMHAAAPSRSDVLTISAADNTRMCRPWQTIPLLFGIPSMSNRSWNSHAAEPHEKDEVAEEFKAKRI